MFGVFQTFYASSDLPLCLALSLWRFLGQKSPEGGQGAASQAPGGQHQARENRAARPPSDTALLRETENYELFFFYETGY